MGAYYNTAEGKFIDFIYKPDREMMLELAKQEVVTQGLKNKLVTLGDQFNDVKLDIFEEYEEEANKIMKPLGENINTLISQVVKDPENVNLNSQLKSAIKEVTKQLQSGDLSKMQNHYATWKSQNKMYEDMLSKAKDEDERTGIKNQQNIYNAWVKEQVSKGYDPNFKIPGGAVYVNAQKILKETVNTEGLKHIITRPGIQTGINYYDPKTGREGKFDPNTMEVDMERRIVKDKNTGQVYGAAISFDPSIKYLTETEFQTYEHTLEGYYQNTIHQVALANLLNNDAFLSMERQKYRLGGAGSVNEKGEKETEQQYIYRKANDQARIYASQYAQTTKDEVTAEVKTNSGALENLKHRNAKALKKYEKDLEKVDHVINITSQTTRRYTPQEATKLFEEYKSYAGRTNLTPAEQARFNNLQSQFGQAFTEEYLDKIMKVSGVFTNEDMGKSREEKIKMVLELPAKIKEAKIKKAKYNLSPIGLANNIAGALTYPLSGALAEIVPGMGYKDPYLEVEDKLKRANVYSPIEQAANNVVYTENAFPLLSNDADVKGVTPQKLLNQHLSYLTTQGATVVKGVYSPYDMYGNIRTQDDSGRDDQLPPNTGVTYLSYLKSIDPEAKIVDWGSAVAAGHATVEYLTYGDISTVIVTPLTVPEGSSLEKGKPFTMIYKDVYNGPNSLQDLMVKNYGKNSRVAEMARNADNRYRLITNKLQEIEATLSNPKTANEEIFFKASYLDDPSYQSKNLKIKKPIDVRHSVQIKDGDIIYKLYDGDTYIEGSEKKYESFGELKEYLAGKYVR
jgi:hypothetical protein